LQRKENNAEKRWKRWVTNQKVPEGQGNQRPQKTEEETNNCKRVHPHATRNVGSQLKVGQKGTEPEYQRGKWEASTYRFWTRSVFTTEEA